jgi:predicted AlkP superfamily pyrophosphatase or phosphodiesterase
MQPILVILVVGLTPALVGPHTPGLRRLAERGAMRPLDTVTPAVTCTVQSTPTAGIFAISPKCGCGASRTA